MDHPVGERVKIIATIGPASADPKVLARMLEEGVDAIRINASHAEPESIADWVAICRKGSQIAKRDVAVMLDLQGIKRRIGDLAESLELKENQKVVFGPRGAGRIPVKAKAVLPFVKQGSDIFLDDGFLRLRVTKVKEKEREVHCRVVRGGTLPSRAGINLPGVPIPSKIPTRQDIRHIEAGVAAGVDLFGLSFVQSAKDLWRCRKLTKGIPIIAKIELPQAVAAIDEIAAASDGILVARGDLAVEMKPEELPVLQKSLVTSSNRARKPVIVATEMLASMVYAPRPTRAELTDVGNAVLDGADALMLSDETAIGHDPARAVRYMARILKHVENSLLEYNIEMPRLLGDTEHRPDWAVADAAVDVAKEIGAKAILGISGSGRTIRLISAGRPSVPIYSVSPDPAVRRRVSVMWGVNASTVEAIPDPDKLIRHVLQGLKRKKHLASNDRVVAVFGSPLWGEGTKTNSIRVATVP